MKKFLTQKNFKIITDDLAYLDRHYENSNEAINQILFFSSEKNTYKVFFYSSIYINNLKGAKYHGIIEKRGLHLSRLFPSKLKSKSNLKCFCGTDLQSQNKNTLFFNFDLGKGILTVKRKITGGII